jgi:biopolymer transport protein TolR
MSMDSGSGALKTDINVTPFCDVCLVLLIIFMVVTPLLQKGVPVILPTVRNPEVQDEKESNIYITLQQNADGVKVYFDAKWVPSDVLRDDLDERFKRNPATPVYIKGDQRVNFVEVKNVLKVIQSVGFKTVGLVAQHVDEKGNPVAGNAAGAISAKK